MLQRPCLSLLAHSKLFPAPFSSPSHVSLIHSLFNFTYHLHLFQKVLPHRVQSSSLVFGALPSLHFPPWRQPQFRSTEGFLSTCLYLLADSVNHHLHPHPHTAVWQWLLLRLCTLFPHPQMGTEPLISQACYKKNPRDGGGLIRGLSGISRFIAINVRLNTQVAGLSQVRKW